MTYSKNILKMIKLIDEILIKYNEDKLLENSKFVVPEGYLCLANYLVIDLVNDSSLGLRFWFDNNSFRIDMAGIDETYMFNYFDIENKKEEIKKLLEMIFTYEIGIESCNQMYKKILFMHPIKKEVFDIRIRHSMLSLFGIRWNCTTVNYPPILQQRKV